LLGKSPAFFNDNGLLTDMAIVAPQQFQLSISTSSIPKVLQMAKSDFS